MRTGEEPIYRGDGALPRLPLSRRHPSKLAPRGLRSRGLRFLLAELEVRLGLLWPWSRWREPGVCSNELLGDDYWILAARWRDYARVVNPARIHPRLGWSQGPLTPLNPQGLIPETRARLGRDGRPKVLFYGDSYVGGFCPPQHWLPTLLEERLAGVDVVHLGVGGYGTDQMHLLFEETLDLVDRPEVAIMGVMDFSFDRVALNLRSYQKPRVEVGPDGRRRVVNLPIDPKPKRFYRRSKPSFRSYLLAALRNERRWWQGTQFLEGFSAKAMVNRALIDANRELAQRAGVQLLYVLFHDHPQLLQPDPREAFFIEELSARGVPTLNTRTALEAHARRAGTDGAELYEAGHHNALGNAVVAEAIAEALALAGSCRDSAQGEEQYA